MTYPVIAAVDVGLNVESSEVELYPPAQRHLDGPGAVRVVRVATRIPF